MRTNELPHNKFWDEYSQSWDEEVKPQIEGDVLGEEWTSVERTNFIFERFAEPYLGPEKRVVEIGPGGGKFSRRLIDRCGELILVDISEEMLERANSQCGHRARQELVEDGMLEGIESGSVDLVFSYDVFIHLESEEVFRYFAEVNRILRHGGVFSVHTSSFETRWGFYSYLEQIRQTRPVLGSRYGGRMYPMTSGILQKFGENSGFDTLVSYSTPQDKDLIFSFQKSRPARAWNFLFAEGLPERFGLSEWVGGGVQREFFAGVERANQRRVLLALGEAGEPLFEATAGVEVPDHPCLVKPEAHLVQGGFDVVVYPSGGPRDFVVWWNWVAEDKRPQLPPILSEILQGLELAHQHGLVHGELDSGGLFWDEVSGGVRVYGLRRRLSGEGEEGLRNDRLAVGKLLEALGPWLSGSPQVLEVAARLREDPSQDLLPELMALLA